ncbi:MAG: hypothetical protein JSU73_09495 [candidate division WOR-3 bacterium]|nr:MAG: hypothetical protein JSU73_09495 [candidate division WOR-3 bacterium]
MKGFLESRGRLALAVTVLAATSRQALAYLDPGTGSYILQMVLAAVLGGLVALGVFWRRVVLFLKRVLGRNETTEGRDKHVGS